MSESGINPVPPLGSPCECSVPGCPLGRCSRVLLTLWILMLAAGFALACSLEPDPRGYGTHQKLGLPPCSFQILFGLRCPSCGSTTSFAYFVRGDWDSAVRSNAAAFGLALISALMIPWGAYSAWHGRAWRIEQPATACVWLLSAVVGLSVIQWAVRLAFG